MRYTYLLLAGSVSERIVLWMLRLASLHCAGVPTISTTLTISKYISLPTIWHDIANVPIFNVKTNKQMVQKKSDDVTKAKFFKSWGWLEYPERTRWKFHSLKISLLVQISHLHNDIVLLLTAESICYFSITVLLNSVSPVTFKWQKHYAQIEFLRSLALVQNCHRHIMSECKQAK